MSEGRFESISASDGASFECYLSGEAGADRPALILFTPIFGADEGVVEIADGWARDGYLVVVPDYFFRVRPGVLDRTEAGREAAFDRWKRLDVDRAIDDLRPLVAMLAAPGMGNGRLGALGFCAGGELAFLAATRLGVEAAAGFHATRIHEHVEEARHAVGRFSLHYGGSDSMVPMDEVDLVRGRLGARRAGDEVLVYPGAKHGFSFRGQPSYDEAAATASRAHAASLMETLKVRRDPPAKA